MLFLALLIASSLADFPWYTEFQYGVLSNGWPGSLNFSYQNTSIQYDNAALPNGSPTDAQICDTVQIFNRYNTWYIKFHRPLPGDQWYYGLLDSNLNCIHGHFFSAGNPYEWDAERGTPSTIGSSSPSSKLRTLFYPYSNQWVIFVNGVVGYLWIHNNSVATIKIDTAPFSYYVPYGNPNPSVVGEYLANFTYVWKYNNWYVQFYRPSTQQWFNAFFDYNWANVYGNVVGPDGVLHPLWGQQSYGPQYSPFSLYVLYYNRWGILANGWPGTLTITGYNSAIICFDDRQLDSQGVQGQDELISGFTFFNSTWNFNYILFYRPLAQQTYIGIFDLNFANIRGYFIQGGVSYPWVGLNLNAPM